jgi:hypothetical protein
MASKSNMCVKLYVNDGCGIDGVGIPLRDLLPANANASLQSGASYNSLRRFALAALFKYSPSGNVPEYAFKNFDTCFSYTPAGGKEVIMTNDAQLTRALEKASVEYLMDDNDYVILDIHCKFVNTFKRDKMKNIRTNATAAADNVITTIKAWIEKAAIVFNTPQKRDKGEDDYVVVAGDNEHKEKQGPAEWADRFVHFLRMPEDEYQASTNMHKDMAILEDTFDNFLLAVAQGFDRASDIIVEAMARQEDLAREVFARTKPNRIESHAPITVFHRSESLSSSDSEEETDVDNGVEIEFDRSDKNTPEEWEIFFGGSSNACSASSGGRSDAGSASSGVVIHAPTADDVVSISSDESDDTFAECNEEHIDHDEDSDGSWAILDNE